MEWFQAARVKILSLSGNLQFFMEIRIKTHWNHLLQISLLSTLHKKLIYKNKSKNIMWHKEWQIHFWHFFKLIYSYGKENIEWFIIGLLPAKFAWHQGSYLQCPWPGFFFLTQVSAPSLISHCRIIDILVICSVSP